MASLLQLPQELLFHIVEMCTRPSYPYEYLYNIVHTLRSLCCTCRTLRDVVQNESHQDILLQPFYRMVRRHHLMYYKLSQSFRDQPVLAQLAVLFARPYLISLPDYSFVATVYKDIHRAYSSCRVSQFVRYDASDKQLYWTKKSTSKLPTYHYRISKEESGVLTRVPKTPFSRLYLDHERQMVSFYGQRRGMVSQLINLIIVVDTVSVQDQHTLLKWYHWLYGNHVYIVLRSGERYTSDSYLRILGTKRRIAAIPLRPCKKLKT